MKLHLPVSLRSALLACVSAVVSLTTTMGSSVFTGGVVSFTLAGVAMAADATSESGNQTLSHSGGNFTWNTTTGDFSNGDETVAFTQGDSVIFHGTSTIKFGEQLTAQCVIIAGGADVTISGDGAGSLALETAEVYGTLKLSKGGENGSFSGDVDVYGTLDFAAGDVTGWSNSLGIKSIDVFEGGRVHVSVGVSGWSNNQTGAGLAINLMGGSITGVSNANLDLGYGGSTYGYSSISARAAADATAENPTVSTVSGTNLTLRQNATTISVAENARLDISSGILIASGKELLNSEGSVPAGITAGLTKTGVGELRLSGNNTYTQATTVAEGTLTLTGGAALASSSVAVNRGAVFKLDTAADTSINYANQISGSGLLLKTGAGSASIGGLADSFAGHINLQHGTLSVGSPVVISSGRELSLGMTGAALDSSLSLGDGKLSIDYSGSGAATRLNNSALTLLGGTQLQLSNLTGGDGKTYELFAGIGSLLGRDGNALVLDDTNNAISNYFDPTRPGSGFWAGATLQLTDAGTLQLVLHNETVKEAITITSQQTNPSAYQYYAGIAFEDISNDSDSTVCGGAIYGYSYSTITLSDNGSITFSGNTASSSSYACGGAIYGNSIMLSNNGSVTFSGNTAESASPAAHGGAIYGDTITLSNNGSVSFSGNTASASSSPAYGGAIYGYGGSTITLSNNGSVTFSGNTAESASSNASGGAIHGYKDITLIDNGSVSFSGNTASASSSYAYGGAICTYGDLSIRNNDSVEFYKNAEVSGNTYRLRSIYADGGSDDEISLSAAAGKSITFYDSVYIGSDATVNLNQDYAYQAENGSSVTIRQQGDIVFTGKYTEQHLNDLLEAAGAGRTATAQEILNSRTTEVCAMTNLYGGRLRVEEGAIYQGRGITAMEGSAATVLVMDATLCHSGYDLTFNAGTTLELAGNNTIAGNVQMLGSSSLVFDNTHGNGTTYIIGSLGFGSDVSLALGNQAYGSNEVLLYVSDAVSGWDAAHLMVQGNSYTADSFTWVDNLLVLNYDESSFSRYFNGSANYNERHEGNVIRRRYESLAFTSETSSSQGSAIYGAGSAVILLSDNGSVTFSGNTASASSSDSFARGGAIYGRDSSTITLSDNGSVVFEGNTASSSASSYSSPAYGGAIYGEWGSTITLSNNGSVTFSGNTAESASTNAAGGAIHGYKDITLIDHGSVTFSGNTASSPDGSVFGGAIYGSVTMTGNGDVSFSGNTASGPSFSAYGGAIYGGSSSPITLSDNGSVTFIGNTASSTYSSAHGGAIYGYGSTITLSDNGSVTFSGNTASSSSPYVYAYGGAINGSSTITLSDNGSVTFSGNTASSSDDDASGGAIYTYGDLSIRNNDSVAFYQNAEVVNGNTYRLRSIYAGGSGAEISLSAAAGKSITFRDSVYIASGSTVNLNADYTYLDEAGESVTIRQTGDIIFTGADTEQHLNDLLEAAGAGRTATAQEILNSRTTEVCAMTNLYGGRLRVEEGAIYQGQGITAMEGSAATVRVQNAELSHEGYDLTFNAGTALEVAGNSTIRGNVNMLADSLFKMEQAATLSLHETLQADAATLTVNGGALLEGGATLNASLTLADGATLDMDALDVGAVTLNGALTFGGQVTMGDKLLGILSEMSGWEESVTLFTGLTDLVLPAVAADDAADRLWVGDVFSNLAGDEHYYFNYKADVGSLSVVFIPEPTTATLSLLALAALAARRRRK